MITVYTKSACPQCMATKRALAKQNADYTEVSLESHPDALQQVKDWGFQQAPVIKIDGELYSDMWSGFRPDKIKEAAAALAQESSPALPPTEADFAQAARIGAEHAYESEEASLDALSQATREHVDPSWVNPIRVAHDQARETERAREASPRIAKMETAANNERIHMDISPDRGYAINKKDRAKQAQGQLAFDFDALFADMAGKKDDNDRVEFSPQSRSGNESERMDRPSERSGPRGGNAGRDGVAGTASFASSASESDGRSGSGRRESADVDSRNGARRSERDDSERRGGERLRVLDDVHSGSPASIPTPDDGVSAVDAPVPGLDGQVSARGQGDQPAVGASAAGVGGVASRASSGRGNTERVASRSESGGSGPSVGGEAHDVEDHRASTRGSNDNNPQSDGPASHGGGRSVAATSGLSARESGRDASGVDGGADHTRGAVGAPGVDGSHRGSRLAGSDDDGPDRRDATGVAGGRTSSTAVDDSVVPGASGTDEPVQFEQRDRDSQQRVPTRTLTRLPERTGVRSRADRNLAALQVLREINGGQATAAQREVLAGWSGWGGLDDVFDERKATYAQMRTDLRELMTESEFAAARRSVLNAHYTAPAYSEAIWSVLKEAGVTAGTGLEPGCGSGSFISQAPDGVAMTGVELDPTTGAIAQHLNPDDEIRVEGFEKTQLPALFDVAVGNVPFDDVRLYDPAHNPGNHSLHNHFIIKSLDLVKPGGYVALLTSSWTMDAQNPAARRDMYDRADLVAAMRLPTSAHRAAAGTEVVTDVLVFRKRAEGENPQRFDWEFSTPTPLLDRDGVEIDHRINTIFQTYPKRVLGDMSVDHGMYRSTTLQVAGPAGQELATRLHDTLGNIVRSSTHLPYAPQTPEIEPVQLADLEQPVGSLRATEDGAERLTATGAWESAKVAKSHVQEVHTLLELMDSAKVLIATESAEKTDSPGLESLRDSTREAYQAYVDSYGPINRNTKTARVTRTTDKETGQVSETETIRVTYPPAVKLLRSDPRAAFVTGIERYDDETGRAKPADILTSRQIYAKYVPAGAENLEDALAICLEHRGQIDNAYIAYLLGTDDDIPAMLMSQRLAFTDLDGTLVPAEEYLSGNVRKKLAGVEAVLDERPELAGSADALRTVIPDDIPIADISAEVGANWIPASDYESFINHLLHDSRIRVQQSGPVDWSVTLNGAPSFGAWQLSTWGTESMRASDIFRKMLKGQPPLVWIEDIDGNKVVDKVASEAAQAKAAEIQNQFQMWVWSDPSRAERLSKVYQERFNGLVGRDYVAAGERLRLPGLASSFKLYDHQRAAIARMIAEPTTGLFHEVGAGKTLEMVCGVMEQKRLGLVNKPLAVVPNHLVGQFENEWLQAYPAANILAIDSSDITTAEKRAEFYAQATTSDWDCIITSQSAFEKIPVSIETAETYQNRELEQFDRALDFLQDQEIVDSMSVRQLEGKRSKREEALNKKLDKLRERQDENALTFEQLGVDYLVVDEAHHFKNLAIGSSTAADLTSRGSGRATDLDMKIDWLREQNERCLTLATATPIANSMGEMWTMTHYLRPDLLEDAGVDVFDAWAHQFAVKDSAVEVKPTGKLAEVQRFARFQNVPELLMMWQTFADVKLAEDLDLQVPTIRQRPDGERRSDVIEVDYGAPMQQFLDRLDDRASMITLRAVSQREDNWLSLTNDSKTFSMDPRLFSEKRQSALDGVDVEDIVETKVDAAARKIAQVYGETKNDRYVDEDGQTEDQPGSLQIVFCDQGTPGTDKDWNVYDELKAQLVERGVPAEKIAFIHDAKNTVEKTQMFVKARTGAIAVLVGSTGKMGTGANMQTRATALHHLDAPWRPADVTQRDGRIIRQGNQNHEVSMFRYVTEKSLDAYMWQTLERKSRFINQVMRGKLKGREVEDISDQELDYAEVKAISTGDPLMLRKVELTNQVGRMSRQEAAFLSNERYLEGRQLQLDQQVRETDKFEKVVNRVMAPWDGGESFSFTINQVPAQDRKGAAEMLQSAAKALNQPDAIPRWAAPQVFYGHVLDLPYRINGVEVTCAILPGRKGNKHAVAFLPKQMLDYAYRVDIRTDRSEWNQTVVLSVDELAHADIGTVRKLENLVNRLPVRAQKLYDKRADNIEERDAIRLRPDSTFPQKDALASLKSELRQVNRELNMRDDPRRSTHQQSVSI